ncbi:isoprenyl transferase [Macrococcus armenti]|uniref:Ditrans,polycis-undecaprenyl-diphosphate synthase ((2E,6E)-farnesyl-diphosphate specific) n=2 Tax=Bacillati TaxID=1783272 RepID=UPPS_MICLU|nr:isoprenyl transferase [Macrococcus armenti]O82827.1 RecName: Full=Ditrans,polycis-undecaprenyl-diphosphate synthase ((2E,6E)-farnesyl-diphosphate specific); AltName: Full=Ditrans,polycis-undecaprenylcistransferase; AltName: Full=Undecaprenyl diphosphate synthase; Short=UDS; AltName: Full=Undecaprenyl pyrophosphate synthase; Short=UPP synthase [Micrococcus luteus]UOB21414.1 isoprenyl transferase [Macrococcus armenti]BAA31993.1 undecaprenyl diphosphate synthase [Micrococcus luteus]
MFPIKKRKAIKNNNINAAQIPKHIAIIMDGNGRWAKQKKMPRIKGHYEGMQTVKKITRYASDLGVKYLTLYAFSTENWSRPKDEVNYLMKLPGDFLNTFLPELIEKNVKVETIGFIDDLPDHTKKAVLEAKEKTKHNTGLTLVFALNYGGRKEIISAVQLIAERYKSGEISLDEISETHFNEYLFTANMPDPELLIRTSGEERLSNFLIWQCSYSEFVFIDEFWPDFNEESLAQCISIYQNRHRRFGGL